MDADCRAAAGCILADNDIEIAESQVVWIAASVVQVSWTG